MAFQAPALPSIAAATTELWPSMVHALTAPFRNAPQQTSRGTQPVATARSRAQATPQSVQQVSIFLGLMWQAQYPNVLSSHHE